MQVTFRFFSISRGLAGCSELPLDVGESTKLSDVLEILFDARPSLRAIGESAMFAVGLDYASRDQPISAGDVIAVIPPVQGG
jgi:molybdopterin converting factor small subunit